AAIRGQGAVDLRQRARAQGADGFAPGGDQRPDAARRRAQESAGGRDADPAAVQQVALLERVRGYKRVGDGIAARLDLARAIARDAGERLLAFRRDRLDIASKGAQDFVTAADRAIEELVREAVART